MDTTTSTLQDFWTMLQDGRVKIYLTVLAMAIWRCTNIYYKSIDQAHAKRRHLNTKTASKTTLVQKILPFSLSLAIIGITWFYIFRFILTNQYTSESYFDDAYKDVLRNHYFTSTQLLTWAIISVIWVSSDHLTKRFDDLDTTSSGIPFLFYGFLGAMGASFVLWIPKRSIENEILREKRERTMIPIVFAITSILAFYCILNIGPCANDDGVFCTEDQGFGSFRDSFHFYLHGLHYVLLLPIAVTCTILPAQTQPKIDATLLYGALGLVISIWHVYQMTNEREYVGSLYKVLETDCQKSIHIDLICCSALTIYAIYHDSLNEDQYVKALSRASIATLMMPIISPAAVLSFYLFSRHFPATQMYLVGKAQRYLTSIRSKSSGEEERGWCNLGLWTENVKSHDAACENLALALGKEAGLNSDDGVLSCGCGTGKEIDFFYSKFNLNHITGIDPNIHIDASSFDVQNVRKVRASVEDLISDLKFRPNLFNKILALDNIYHYVNKRGFFQHCAKILPVGGKLAFTDIIWKPNGGSFFPPWYAKIFLSAMGVKSKVMTEAEYKSHLANVGFINISVKRIGKDVYSGWKGYLPVFLLHHLDYCIIVANKPDNKKLSKDLKKKKVAVIGSGMAGCASAYAIYTASICNDIEVTIYESSDRPGLAGNTRKVGNQLVDVPARMAAIGYYKKYIELVKSLGIEYEVVYTDCIFHGGDGNGGYVKYTYERSGVLNFFKSIFQGGIRHLYRITLVFSSIPQSMVDIITLDKDHYSFGDWLGSYFKPTDAHFNPNTVEVINSKREQEWYFTNHAGHKNGFLYMTMGSFGWMLSCSYKQLLNCPAKILLPYIYDLGLTKYMGVFKKASVVRIQPSIKALEHALLYGINLECNSSISNLDENKTINGIKYDAVICATEASAVNKVVKGCSDIFQNFIYHPSIIYLHKDEALLPRHTKDWRTWEVRMEPDQQDEPQLTFWLNRYYDHIQFDGNVFQTWAPLNDPDPEKIIDKFYMSRVIHTNRSKELVDDVQDEQGKRGFYYAGSYAVYGMGLLEEAVKSGQLAAEKVVMDLCY